MIRAGMRVMLGAAALMLATTAAQAQDAPAATPAPMDRGEYVARLANCVACHSVPDAPAFTGGLKMMTPLGAVYATNITPDPATGIGTYTLEDFDRAVRLGVAKDGHRLYPAMPYPSYAKLSAEDVKALYDYFMKSVPAVNQANVPPEDKWLLKQRWAMAVWNLFFFDDEPYEPKADRDAAWNRGAYIVQGPGHCGACHTPRGLAFNEKGYDEDDGDWLIGAPLDNWSAVNLTQAHNTGLGRWSVDDIVAFMKTGKNQHGTAFGTMIEVINNSSQYMTDADHRAVATYLKSLPARNEGVKAPYAYDKATAEMLRTGKVEDAGAIVYVQQCQSCHGAEGKGAAPYLPPLAGNPTVLDPDAVSLINIVLNGSARIVVQGMPDAYRMPQGRLLMTDQKIADAVSFIRASWGNKAAPVTAAQVAEVRAATNPASDRVEILRMK